KGIEAYGRPRNPLSVLLCPGAPPLGPPALRLPDQTDVDLIYVVPRHRNGRDVDVPFDGLTVQYGEDRVHGDAPDFNQLECDTGRDNPFADHSLRILAEDRRDDLDIAGLPHGQHSVAYTLAERVVGCVEGVQVRKSSQEVL